MKLLTTLKAVQLGKIQDKWGWLDRVPDPSKLKMKHEQQNGINGSNVNLLP
jgi:hypothetical protein